MCTKRQLDTVLREVSRTAKEVFGGKLSEVILYGSYARGDYDTESDVDLLVLADIEAQELSRYKKPFAAVSSSLGMEYDVVITVTLRDVETFERFRNVVPFYQNVLREGVTVGGRRYADSVEDTTGERERTPRIRG